MKKIERIAVGSSIAYPIDKLNEVILTVCELNRTQFTYRWTITKDINIVIVKKYYNNKTKL